MVLWSTPIRYSEKYLYNQGKGAFFVKQKRGEGVSGLMLYLREPDRDRQDAVDEMNRGNPALQAEISAWVRYKSIDTILWGTETCDMALDF
jgi:hypothetical protein